MRFFTLKAWEFEATTESRFSIFLEYFLLHLSKRTFAWSIISVRLTDQTVVFDSTHPVRVKINNEGILSDRGEVLFISGRARVKTRGDRVELELNFLPIVLPWTPFPHNYIAGDQKKGIRWRVLQPRARVSGNLILDRVPGRLEAEGSCTEFEVVGPIRNLSLREIHWGKVFCKPFSILFIDTRLDEDITRRAMLLQRVENQSALPGIQEPMVSIEDPHFSLVLSRGGFAYHLLHQSFDLIGERSLDLYDGPLFSDPAFRNMPFRNWWIRQAGNPYIRRFLVDAELSYGNQKYQGSGFHQAWFWTNPMA